VAYTDLRRFPRLEPQCRPFVADGGRAALCDAAVCTRLANILDTRSFITVPYAQRDGTEGRLYLTSASRSYSTSDGDFLVQFSATVAVVSESLRLMQELISRAAEHERYKISRDLHDSTIQPYIGLKLGLEGLYREIEGPGAVADRIRDLIAMTNQTVRDLRQYADRLRAEKGAPDEFLVAAVKEQADRYYKYYGIRFEVHTHLEGRISGRIAAEVFQMVTEGMSNVLKHTAAKRGGIALASGPETLTLRIVNEAPENPPRSFAPRSLAERTAALGGHIAVQPSENGQTVIETVIPI
jgi:signal transduction histidine kinase